MEKRNMAFFYILILSNTYNFLITKSQPMNDNVLETYIVHVEQPEFQTLSKPGNLETYYKSFLPESSANGPSPSLVYSYRHVITGFAAKLTPTHLKSMEKMDGFLFARPQQILALFTTHSPQFLGLNKNTGIWPTSNYGKGVIIGLVDSGITPNHPSFSDQGMPPPPKKWKGKCEFIKCNNKLIGARSFVKDSTPDDVNDGHGTHTSSTAAGNFVTGVEFFGQANGTAVGMAPRVHIAMYKACTFNDCNDSSILAAMDTAIEDGVDILSLSLGNKRPFMLYSEAVSYGSYAAIQRGIFVSCAARNSGPGSAKLVNGAPWILTMGASTMDRTIKSTAVLGNKEQFDGETLYQPRDFPPTPLPLIYAQTNDPKSTNCNRGSLGNIDVKGKVVLCKGFGVFDGKLTGEEVKAAGGAGMIFMNDILVGYTIIPERHVLPTVHVSYSAGLKIIEYINSTTEPTTAILFKGTVIGEKAAPEVSFFSSRGPNYASPGILKPDIIGPGVNVLAAWPYSGETPAYEIETGTSMSCPHLSGIAALLISVHPNWSPAAIKSAIMTTADIENRRNELILDEQHQPANIFAIGSGHVNASRAMDPGLIYDLKPDDYIPYLCGLNYTNQQVYVITRTKVNCSEVTVIQEPELNYPSFSVVLLK